MKRTETRILAAVSLYCVGAIFATLALLFLTRPEPASAQGTPRRFDHLTTGFELEGAHRDVPCESCHVAAMFKGTPKDCRGCHAQGSRINALAKPASHILSSESCGECHSTVAWSPADRFDHLQVRGSCASCHNNIQATGKPLDHVASSDTCDTCHTTTAWVPARFDHLLVRGNCVSCHNGVQATGKSANHIASSDNCDSCHSTTAWTPARFDHASVAPGSCSTCHNGVGATGKPASHIPTTAECDSCHSTVAWTPAMFDHAGVTGGCQGCHNGATATGKNVGHMSTARECNICHSTSAWTPLTFQHTSPEYPGDHRGNLPCVACHTTNTDQATWTSPAYRPDCAGCHANDFRADPHIKIINTNVRYTVGELRNCSGACHVYTDATLTTISRARPGPEHRVNGGEF